jgi:hypothetical protein
MTEFKKGDLVKVVRKFRSDEGDLNWMPAMDKLVGVTAKVERVDEVGDVLLDCGWYFYPRVLEHVGKSHAACILTEKVTVSGVPCRKILGFEGVLPCDELPEKYMGGKPRFFLSECTDSKYMFDGEVHRWVVHGCKIGIECVKYEIPEQSNPEVILDDMPIHRLATDEVYSETTFQAIVVWLKRAGARLAKIRQQEKDAWSGKEMVEI